MLSILSTALILSAPCSQETLPAGYRNASGLVVQVAYDYRPTAIPASYEHLFMDALGVPTSFPGNAMTRIVTLVSDEIAIIPFTVPADTNVFKIEFQTESDPPRRAHGEALAIPNMHISECPGSFLVHHRCYRPGPQPGGFHAYVVGHEKYGYSDGHCPLEKGKTYYLHVYYTPIRWGDRRFEQQTHGPLCPASSCSWLFRVLAHPADRVVFPNASPTPRSATYVNLLNGAQMMVADRGFTDHASNAGAGGAGPWNNALPTHDPVIPSHQPAELTDDRKALIERLGVVADQAKGVADVVSPSGDATSSNPSQGWVEMPRAIHHDTIANHDRIAPNDINRSHPTMNKPTWSHPNRDTRQKR